MFSGPLVPPPVQTFLRVMESALQLVRSGHFLCFLLTCHLRWIRFSGGQRLASGWHFCHVHVLQRPCPIAEASIMTTPFLWICFLPPFLPSSSVFPSPAGTSGFSLPCACMHWMLLCHGSWKHWSTWSPGSERIASVAPNPWEPESIRV